MTCSEERRSVGVVSKMLWSDVGKKRRRVQELQPKDWR